MMELPTVAAEEPRVGQLTLEDRLRKLGDVEKELHSCLQSAYNFMSELSKEKAPQPRSLEPMRNKFTESMRSMEKELYAELDRMSQVSVGSSHEGSAYIPRQKEALAAERLSLVQGQMSSELSQSEK